MYHPIEHIIHSSEVKSRHLKLSGTGMWARWTPSQRGWALALWVHQPVEMSWNSRLRLVSMKSLFIHCDFGWKGWWRWKDCGCQVQDLWLWLCHCLLQVRTNIIQMLLMHDIGSGVLTCDHNFHPALPRSGSRENSWQMQPRSRTATSPRFHVEPDPTEFSMLFGFSWRLSHFWMQSVIRNCLFLQWSCTAPCWLRMPFRWSSFETENVAMTHVAKI